MTPLAGRPSGSGIALTEEASSLVPTGLPISDGENAAATTAALLRFQAPGRTKLAALSGRRETGATQSRAQSPSDAALCESTLAVANEQSGGGRLLAGKHASAGCLPNPQVKASMTTRKSRDVRRDEVLAAALEEFAELDVYGASTEDIATRGVFVTGLENGGQTCTQT